MSDTKEKLVSPSGIKENATLETKNKCNGKISLRLPRSLHRDLVKSAKDEGVSLNQFILYKLSNN